MNRRHRIILIEDSRTQAERVRLLFAEQGWDVVYFPSAEAALQELDRARADLIVVDYHLPGMNGDEFCREIRLNVNTRGISVLMLTVDDTGDAETRGLESGADDYLAKTVDPDILLVRVRALLRKSGGPASIVESGTFLSRARLLAIDDSPTFLHYLVEELSADGYTLEKARSGAEGIARLREEAFDGVLVDFEMPGMDGLQVCRQLAEMRSTADSPFVLVMLTSHEDKEYMTRALEAGADDFIGKSAGMSVVRARIRALLRRKSFLEENRRILDELKDKELEAVRARAEKEAAEIRATMADKLARSNRELEQANRKLEEALEVTKAITQHAAEALYLLDPAGRVTFANPAAERMFGFSARELLGRVLHERVHRRRADGRAFPASECPLVKSCSAGAALNNHEDVFYRQDGTAVDVACSIAPIFEDGRLKGAVLVVHDISERKRSEERLRQAQKLESIGVLAGGVAHDFNNILTSIIGTGSLIQEELPYCDPDKMRTVMESAEKAADLTRQLLAYAGKGQFVIAQLDVSTVVRELSALMKVSLPKRVELRFDLEPSLPEVAADPGHMQQVLMNLVVNAGEAIGSAGEGTVTVSTGMESIQAPLVDAAGAEVAAGSYVYVQVADTGSGMDEHTRARIFDPFFSTKFTGRGLGLAAVAGILRSLRGGIAIDTAPGRGATFRVLFPPAAGWVQPQAAPRLILVADDEEAVRNFLRSALERQGYFVLQARDGNEALALWQEHRARIALVILDVLMPVKGGAELAAGLVSRDPGIRVLLTSACEEGEARRLCAALPNAPYLRKPYTARALLEKVREATNPAASAAAPPM